ncbi:DNA methyltransferase [Leucobacter sp. HY1910]
MSGMFDLHAGDVLDVYHRWPEPALIISDGAYGVGGFPGDPKSPERLADWYAPHVAAWTQAATGRTTLCFWNTEIGWAEVHPLLREAGWKYVETVTWDKGVGHVAGNVNGDTIRRFPVVTEVCAIYERATEIAGQEMQAWLRSEWQRSGLPMYLANEACGVKSAASRKWLTADQLWYQPPLEAIELMGRYCDEHGDPDGAPYFAASATECEAARDRDALARQALRRPWTHTHGLTNVWDTPSLRGAERIKTDGKALHPNQKPLELMARLVSATTEPGDVVWEPFGGLASASVAAVEAGRHAYVSESNQRFAQAAQERLTLSRQGLLGTEQVAA